MQQRREQRPAEIALIVLASLVIGLILGAAGGFLLGRSSIPAPSVQVVTAVVFGTPQSATTAPEIPSVEPVSIASTVALTVTTIEPSAAANTAEPTSSPQVQQTVVALPTAATTSVSGQPTAIPIPVARTATPPPPVSVDVTITDQRATELATTVLASSPAGAFLNNPKVRFTEGQIELTGEVNDPLGRVGSGPLLVRGEPVVEGANLRIKIREASINGQEAPDDVVAEIEGMMNDVFRAELSDRKVERVSAIDGQLNATVLQR